jgi:outer membrane protein assembly factor BamB
MHAENWPQWRGPSSLGVSSEQNLPVEWSAEEGLAWKVPIAGLGVSSPVVWDGMVFITSQLGYAPVAGGAPLLARDDSSLSERESAIGGRRAAASAEVTLVVEAFRLSDGERLFQYKMPARGDLPESHEKHNLATPTPVTDGERVYAWFGNGQLVALDMQGKPVWARHLAEDYGTFLNNWGHGSSPALNGDLLILLSDHEPNSYLVAFDKRTGKEAWRVDRGKDRISHSTPVIVPGPRGSEMLVNSTERVDAYDPANGKLLWSLGDWRQTPIPTPVFHDGMIYMARGYRNSDILAVRPGGRGDVTESHIAWRMPNGGSYVPSVLYYDGLVYMTNEVGVLTCANAKTGESVKRQRLQGVFFASPVAGDGKVYMTSETGEVIVLEAGPEATILARNDLAERLIASPAIAQGKLVFRSDRSLIAVGR